MVAALLIPLSRWILIVLAALLVGPTVMLFSVQNARADWRTASREPVGLAPDPARARQAMVQVYGARAVSWRGAFGVHTWFAVKPTGAAEWTTYQIIGWRALYGGDALVVTQGPPDRRWFGAEPELYAQIEGEGVDAVIARIVAAAEAYPWRGTYTLWPGPNSNTFTAMVARAAPELRLDLPSTAIGKDYLGPVTFAAKAPSGTGFQLSLWGLLGLTLAKQEGLEINVAGLTFGIDPLGLAIKAPGIGRIGPAADPVRAHATD
ncbi:MAG: DUF3750 domain-containing protein [Alphaproteobacteria bacterium]|nr:DUF3750 domain-containing protein [Alphaproteobacteria bacterium]